MNVDRQKIIIRVLFFMFWQKIATPTKAPLHPSKAVPDTVPITGSVTVPTPAPPTAPFPDYPLKYLSLLEGISQKEHD
ncbi:MULTISPECIES: hypothetical protein [Phocaeicola]|jgi:hypothetical protein|uniref:hypothetical protein n=1 Tax=Phocaeicola TaxID=909656 RepID=UPI0026E0813B|nr:MULTISPECIES: hypothetical protein [Phocaeicola]MDO5879031.1 hypothetical protein [Phocaeicola vulgatus]MDO6367924.1 hypothetical protein [Phocaeicola vulgatus]MDQ8007404.1 hypothetical protein [Phocaeicola sp. GP0067]MDU0981552.1 hypothetical protein [Phocaeicola vulgatus]